MTTPGEPQASARPDGRATRWSGHRQRRRQSIVDTAIDVIDTVGPHFRLDDIAQAAGVTRQVLYRQFDDREDLDSAITDRVALMVQSHLASHLDTESGTRAGIRKVLSAYLDFIETRPGLYRFVRAHEKGRSADAVSGVKNAIAEISLQIAKQMISEGVLAPAVPADKAFALGLIGMVDASVTHWLNEDSPAPREQLVEGLTRMLDASVHAILGRAPASPSADG